MKIALRVDGLPLEVNLFKGGASLPFHVGDVEYSLGMLSPGFYDFGETQRQETIRVNDGRGSIAGTKVLSGDVVAIPKGTPLEVVVDQDSILTYTCAYGILGALMMARGRLVGLGLANGQTLLTHNSGLNRLPQGGWMLHGNAGDVELEDITTVKIV